MADTKKRRILQTDWDRVEKFVIEQLDARKTSKVRSEHERIWKEVDRQIAMQPMQRIGRDGKAVQPEKDWHAALELGDISTASEIITDDVTRIQFPADRYWFQPHIEINWPLDPATGKPKADEDKQSIADGLLRNLMGQQHKDFGFKARYELSIKEALHHGSLIAEVDVEQNMMVSDGSNIRVVSAPVWIPYSMWNAYPDPSPSVIGTNMFYTGAMILVSYKPLNKLRRVSGPGWITERIKKVEKRSNKNKDDDTEDVELVKYKGDVLIDRKDGDDIFLPNSDIILANGKLVYYAPGKLPYPNVIFAGYERQDIRDPYYTSPIIKQSPTHKMTTIIANKFVDAVGLKVEPPVEYDSNDPDYAANDGPVIAPGAKTGTRSMGQGMKALDIGDPRFALEAYTLGKQELKEGLGVSANRAGVREKDRETATAATLANQGAEVRTMGFIQKLEPQALLPFLYMQHQLNRQTMTEYTFYNDEMHTPDFIRATRKDVDRNAHFEVVGSRGVLGEQQRQQRIMQTTAFFAGSPLFAGKLAVEEIMLQGYRDAGKKNPEEFIKTEEGGPQIPPQVVQAMQEMKQLIQQLTQENAALKSKHDETMAKLAQDAEQFRAEFMNERSEFAKEFQLKLAQFKADLMQASHERNQERMQSVVSINAGDEIGKVAKNLQDLATNQSSALMQAADLITKAAGTMQQATSEMNKERPRRKLKIKRVADGYEAEA